MQQFIKDNLKYPKQALENKVEGSVFIQYQINPEGKVSDTKVLKGLGHGCDEEALRLVKALEFKPWRGPENNNVKITSRQKIAIHFRLKDVKQPAKINYTYTQQKPTQEEPPVQQKFGYTIKFG